MIIAVDVGYGFSKALNEYQRSAVFPSLVAPGQDRSLEGILARDSPAWTACTSG